ncbi:MAG: phage head closure protein [Rikenellaceae bacterium]
MYTERIEIYALSQERDEYNERTEELVLMGVYYAQRTESGGRENLYASRIVHENEVVFTIRYTPKIRAGMVLKYNDTDMEIISTHQEGRAEKLHIKCLKTDAKS